MLVSSLRQRLVVPTVLVRVIGVHAALFLLLILVVGCGGQSSTDVPAPEPEPTPESGPNKREVAVKEGSLRDLVQERVGDFDLQGVVDEGAVEELLRDELNAPRELDLVDALWTRYVGSGGVMLEHFLVTMRSPEDADNLRQQAKRGAEVVDEQPVEEASGRRVGTATVVRIQVESSKEAGTLMVWNNGNLVALAQIDEGERDAVESFYESVPY